MNAHQAVANEISLPHLPVKNWYIALQTNTVVSSDAMATINPERRSGWSCSHMAMPDKAQKHIRNAIASTNTARTVVIIWDFFSRGSCGYSCGRDGRTLEGIELRTMNWSVEPLAVDEIHSAYFSDNHRFPQGSIEFDHALLMRGIPHEWHELRDVPELAADFAAP